MPNSNSFSSTYTVTTSTPIEIGDELHEGENINLDWNNDDGHDVDIKVYIIF